MKNIKLLGLIAVGSMLHAGGGEHLMVSPYENEKVVVEKEAYVEPIVEPVPVVIAPVPLKDVNPSGFYAGLGISAAQYKTNCSTGCSESGKDKTAGLMARVGYDFNKYIGIEARGIRTNWGGDGGKIKHAGIYVKPMVPVGDATNIYGLVGVAKTTTQGSLQRTDSEALALGVGLEYDLSKDTPKEGRYGRPFDGKGNQEKGLGLFVDYERMVVKSGAPDLDAVSTGVTYDF